MQRKFSQRFVIRFVEITNTAAATRVSTANTVEVGAVSVAHRYVKTMDASRLTTIRNETRLLCIIRFSPYFARWSFSTFLNGLFSISPKWRLNSYTGTNCLTTFRDAFYSV